MVCNSAGAVVEIDASKNAIIRNNEGVNYLKEGYPYAAIASFGIALGLNPSSEASATIYNNLGTTYMQLEKYELAQECFETALKFSPMNFSYYQNLVSVYAKRNLLKQKLSESNKTEYTDQVLDGLILLQLGQYQQGYVLLQNFVEAQPNLILTGAIKEFLRNSEQNL